MSGDVANAIALLKKLTKVNTKKKHPKPFLPMAALQDCKVSCPVLHQVFPCCSKSVEDLDGLLSVLEIQAWIDLCSRALLFKKF